MVHGASAVLPRRINPRKDVRHPEEAQLRAVAASLEERFPRTLLAGRGLPHENRHVHPAQAVRKLRVCLHRRVRPGRGHDDGHGGLGVGRRRDHDVVRLVRSAVDALVLHLYLRHGVERPLLRQKRAAGRLVEDGDLAVLAVLAVVHERHRVIGHRLPHRTRPDDEQLHPLGIRPVPDRQVGGIAVVRALRRPAPPRPAFIIVEHLKVHQVVVLREALLRHRQRVRVEHGVRDVQMHLDGRTLLAQGSGCLLDVVAEDALNVEVAAVVAIAVPVAEDHDPLAELRPGVPQQVLVDGDLAVVDVHARSLVAAKRHLDVAANLLGGGCAHNKDVAAFLQQLPHA